jgi:hypothetical protein
MSETPLVAVSVVDHEVPGELVVPPPTLQQEQTADSAFATPIEHHPAVDLLGMVASVHFLHDLAGEMFQQNKLDDEEEEKSEKEPQAKEGE